MITYSINKIISLKKEIKLLNNALKSSLSRIKVVLKSLKSNMRVDCLASLSAYTVKVQHNNQHRAPPAQHPPF